MSNTVISVEHLSKAYRLGQIGTPSRMRGERGHWHNDLQPRGTDLYGYGLNDTVIPKGRIVYLTVT